jgi:hypothetical protein
MLDFLMDAAAEPFFSCSLFCLVTALVIYRASFLAVSSGL